MSAYVVDRVQIDVLMLAAQQFGRQHSITWKGDEENDSEMAELTVGGWAPNCRQVTGDLSPVGRMLWRENVRSVQYRYEDTIETGILPGPADFSELDTMTYTAPGGIGPALDPVKVLVALRSYEYQSCEHPGWETSEAHAFCGALRFVLIEAIVAAHPGARECWSITSVRDCADTRSADARARMGGAR